MTFSQDQLDAIRSGATVPVTIDDQQFVVIPLDTFDEMRMLLDQAELRSIFARSIKSSNWNDPAMDIYDDYDNAKR